MRQVTGKDNFDMLAKLLNNAFITVADEFGLTRENCASNNAFITSDVLKSKLTLNREFYYLENNNNPIGFIAIENSNIRREYFLY